MAIIRGVAHLSKRHQGGWLTIGNYDGIHVGHQQIVNKLMCLAAEDQSPAQVMTFEPSPSAYFQPLTKLSRLMSLKAKVQKLHHLGIDDVICLKFNQAIAELTPEAFAKQILCDALKIKGILVGEDFRFGHQQKGNITTLRALGLQHQFKVEVCRDFKVDRARVSSSRIRETLAADNFALAAKLLGGPFSLTARVGHGEKRGRLLGFPTANLVLPKHVLPLKGVYYVKVSLLGKPGEVYDGLINIGTKPTFKGQVNSAEVHIIDFAEDIYGDKLTVDFIHKVRDEERFKSVDALKSQIQDDVQSVTNHINKVMKNR